MPKSDDAATEPVGFEQDDQSDDFGDGYFVYADGTRKYSSDPETAKKLDQQGKASVGTSGAAPKLDSSVMDFDEPEASPTGGVKTAPPTAAETAGLQPSAADLESLEPKAQPKAAAAPVEAQPVENAIQIPDASRIAKSHNNPGNLKYAGQAGAEEGEPAKGGGHWAKFASPEAGYDAIGRQIDGDAAKGMTVRNFVENYAPKKDGNDTEGYVADAAKSLGVDPNAPLGEVDKTRLQRFVARRESSTVVPETFRGVPYAPGETAPKGTAPRGPYREGAAPPPSDADVAQARQANAARATAEAGAGQLPMSEQQENATQSGSNQNTESLNTGASVQRTGSAMPEEQFQASQGALGSAYDRAIQTADDNRYSEAAAQANREHQLAQMARDREVTTAAAQAHQDQRRTAVSKKISEVTSRPTDVNKIWKDKGALGTVLGAIGVFLGGVSAYTMGRENSALKAIQEQKQQALRAQMDDRDSELHGLERELGSLDAAVPIYEARMNQAIGMRLDSQLAGEKSQAALRNGAQLKNQLEIERQQKLKEGAQAYYGTLAQQESRAASQQATAGTQSTSGLSTGRSAKTDLPDVELKQAEAQRDLDYLKRSGLKEDEYRKEQTEYSQKASKANAFRGSLDTLSKTLGVSVTKNEDGSVTVSGKPDVGVLPSSTKRAVDSAYADVKRADIENMTREPAKDLVDDFTELTNRPFWDDEIVPKLQRMYDMQGHVQDELDGGYNPFVVDDYKQRAKIREKKPARQVTGMIPAAA